MANRCDVLEPVLFDILLFLPVISLLRFKTVCKSWCSIIESSDFVTQHLHHNSENKKGLLVLGSENELCFLSGSKYQVQSNSMYEQMFSNTYFNIVNSCNGIVCVHTNQGTLLSLWNPATKQVRKVPESAELPMWIRTFYFSAFGFDKKTNDYKIVRIGLQCERERASVKHSLVQVYSMSTDSWRIIHKGNDFPIAYTKSSVDVVSNGEMSLWIGTSLSLLALVIFYFDLANEVYGTVPLPDHAARPKAAPTTNLAFLNGKITYIECGGPRKICSYYEIWMMDEFGKKESWNSVYKLEEPILPCDYVSEIHLKNGEFILTEKHSGNDVGLYLFDLVTREEILLFDACKVSRIINYSESLVSIKSTKLT